EPNQRAANHSSMSARSTLIMDDLRPPGEHLAVSSRTAKHGLPVFSSCGLALWSGVNQSLLLQFAIQTQEALTVSLLNDGNDSENGSSSSSLHRFSTSALSPSHLSTLGSMSGKA